MDLFDLPIKVIHSEKMLSDRIVEVDLTYDFYGGPQRVTVAFFYEEWKRFKRQMSYPEIRALSPKSIDYFLKLSDDDWYQFRYATKLSEFTDQEIVNELNRRLDNNLTHHISFDVKAIVKEGR